MLVRNLQFRSSVGEVITSWLVVCYREDPVGKSSFSMPTPTMNGSYHEKQILEYLTKVLFNATSIP